MRQFARFRPAVDRRTLLWVSFATWGTVGVVLSIVAVLWLTEAEPADAVVPAVLGLAAAPVIHRFGFSRIVARNLRRIATLPERACVFGWQPWRSYLLLAVMMTTGYLLRHSDLPRPWLALVYLAIGGALALSSTGYARAAVRDRGAARGP